jgi:uncharacterized protein YecE (DUF72 family)
LRLYIGTCGWSYKEWVGKFYPEGTRPSINFYTNFFNALEIDSTYYSTPTKESFTNMLKKIKGTVKLSVKLPSTVSHFGEFKKRMESMEVFRESVIETLERTYQDSLVLFTIPPWINEGNMENYLEEMSIITKGIKNVYVEPRIFREGTFESIVKTARKFKINISFTDNFSHNLDLENGEFKNAYIRLHGRNPDFIRSQAGMSKFSYNYSENELNLLGNEIKNKGSKYEDLFIFFNNHPNGNAAQNAIYLSKILGKEKQSFL